MFDGAVVVALLALAGIAALLLWRVRRVERALGELERTTWRRYGDRPAGPYTCFELEARSVEDDVSSD